MFWLELKLLADLYLVVKKIMAEERLFLIESNLWCCITMEIFRRKNDYLG